MVDMVVSKSELIDAQKDAQALDDIVNGAAEVRVQTRLGRYVWTLATLEQRSLLLIDQWQSAISMITVDSGTPALAISDASGKNQQQINNELRYSDNIYAWSGRTQDSENKDFVSSVYDYSGFNTIAALDGRLVYVKKIGVSGEFKYVSNSVKLHDGGTVIKDSQNRIWERVFKGNPSILWFEPATDGITDNTSKFIEANTITGITYIPFGSYKTNIVDGAKYFGEGKLVVPFDGVDYDFYCSNVPQIIPSSLITYGDGVKEINTALYIGSNSGRSAKTNESMVVAIGGRALENSGTSLDKTTRTTAIGAHAARRAPAPFSATAIGDSALENGKFYQRVVAVGSNAMQFAGDNTPLIDHHEFLIEDDPYGLVAKNTQFRSMVGTGEIPLNLPLTSDDAKESVAVGRNSLLHAVKTTGDVALGYNAMAHAWNTDGNVAIGHGSMRDAVSSIGNVAVGARSSENLQNGAANVSIGRESFQNAVHLQNCTAIGYRAMQFMSGGSPDQETARGAARQNLAIGAYAMQNSTSGVNMVAVGNTAFQNAIGSQSVAVGVGAGSTLTSAINTTLIGFNAGTKTLGGSPTVTLTNSSALGYDAPLSGDNQIQLGNSLATVYAYGAVQDRSDIRDKSDIQVMPDAMSGFILGLNPVQGRWDMRDDYMDDLPENWTDEQKREWWVNPEKDGSKKRQRLHNWFIAQEVKSLADSLGIDFAGLQDHKLINGADILTIGYEEFIPPIVATLQKAWKRIDDIDERLKVLEK